MDFLQRQETIEMQSSFAVYLFVCVAFLVVSFVFNRVDRWFRGLGRSDE